jgi:hypothetical protein
MFAATSVELCPLGGCVAAPPTTTTSTSTTTPDGSVVPDVASVTDLLLTDSQDSDRLTLSFEPVGDNQVKFVLQLNAVAWISFGFSVGTSISMTGGGDGADVVVCADGVVSRYWLTNKQAPANPNDNINATCTQANGLTTMTFTRNISAVVATERSLTPGTPQQVIYAYGNDGVTGLQFHNDNFGGKFIDLSSEGSGEAVATTTTTTSTSIDADIDIETRIGQVSDLPLAPAGSTSVTLSFEPIGEDSVNIVLKLQARAWIGFGISAGTTVSMTGEDQGADVVTCAQGEVRRYWVTSRSLPNDADDIADAICTQDADTTTLSFTRSIAAVGANQRSITPGQLQQVIYAHGNDGEVALAFHASNAGGQGIDFSTGATAEAEKRSGEVALYLHLIMMTFAWGGCLPLGVAVASRTKSVPGAAKGAWFRVHRTLQMIGWAVQLLGFGMAVWYSQVYGSHFRSIHAVVGIVVVVIATLQPLNAALRPHPSDTKTVARLVFEIVHKGLGWLAVLLGMANVFIGIALVRSKNYDGIVLSIASILAAFCISPVLAFFALASCSPDNSVSRCILRVQKDADESVSRSIDDASCPPPPLSTKQLDGAFAHDSVGLASTQTPPKTLPTILAADNGTHDDPMCTSPKVSSSPEPAILVALTNGQSRTGPLWTNRRVAASARAAALAAIEQNMEVSEEV